MKNDSGREYKKIAVLENAIEAQLLASILEERNIPHRLQSYHDTAYDGLFQAQKGWGVLYVPGSIENEVLDILHDLRCVGGKFK